MKEQFYTSDNVLSKTDIEQVIVKGVKSASPVIPVGANTNDANGARMQFGNTYHDVAGDLGTAGLWYVFYMAAGLVIQNDYNSGLTWSTHYKASDDNGLTWTAASGILHPSKAGLIVINPDDANLVQGYFKDVGQMTMHYAERANLADMSANVGAGTVYDNVDISNLSYFGAGKYVTVNQKFFNRDSDSPYTFPVDPETPVWNGGDTDKYQRLSRIDIAADISLEANWEFGTSGSFQTTTKSVSGVKNDHTNSDANIIPQDEPHLGSIIALNTDINGDDQFVLGVSFQKRTTSTGWHSGTITPGLSVIGDIANDSIFTRVRSDDDSDAVLVDRGGTWDAGIIWMLGGLLESGDSLIGLYTGFNNPHEDYYEDAVKTYAAQIGRVVWRKDGMTSIQNTDGVDGDFKTTSLTKPSQSRIRLNYDGIVSAELLDAATDVVMTGYSSDECDLASADDTNGFLSWDGKQALDIPTFKIRWYLTDGSTVTDLYSFSFEQDTYDADNLVPVILNGEPVTIYKAYSGKVFSQDGVNYYRGVDDGFVTSAAPIGLTSYV